MNCESSVFLFLQLIAFIYYGFCWLLTAIVSRTFQFVCEISRGKTSNLHSMYRHHLHILIPFSLWDFILFSRLIHSMCLIMFVFLRSEICRRLPSDSTSRWTPLPWANGWQLIAPITDLNLQIYSSYSAHHKKEHLTLLNALFLHKKVHFMHVFYLFRKKELSLPPEFL